MQFSTYWRGFSCAATSPTPATKRIIATLDAVFMIKNDITTMAWKKCPGWAYNIEHAFAFQYDLLIL